MAVAHGGTATRRFAPRTVGASRLNAEAAEGVSLPPRLLRRHPTSQTAHSAYRSSLLDASPLFHAGPVDFRRIPPWRHQTGSSFPEWFPVLPTCFSGRPRPPEARPILRNIKHRSGILLPVCCRHAGFSTKSSGQTSTSTNISWDPSRTPATASKPMAHSKILRVETW